MSSDSQIPPVTAKPEKALRGYGTVKLGLLRMLEKEITDSANSSNMTSVCSLHRQMGKLAGQQHSCSGWWLSFRWINYCTSLCFLLHCSKNMEENKQQIVKTWHQSIVLCCWVKVGDSSANEFHGWEEGKCARVRAVLRWAVLVCNPSRSPLYDFLCPPSYRLHKAAPSHHSSPFQNSLQLELQRPEIFLGMEDLILGAASQAASWWWLLAAGLDSLPDSLLWELLECPHDRVNFLSHVASNHEITPLWSHMTRQDGDYRSELQDTRIVVALTAE